MSIHMHINLFYLFVFCFFLMSTLMFFRTIFEVDIESFEEKPWRYPGVDMTDYFNFGLNEEGWKDYCKQLVINNCVSYPYFSG